MKALTFHGPGQVRFESAADPVLRGPGEALVRVTLTAICGSDLHPYRGREKGLDEGTVLGHEFVGEVVESTVEGKGAVSTGDRVVAPFSTSCGDCFFCRRGLTSRCELGQLFGWRERGRGLHGGQAELVRVPLAGSSLLPIPEGVDDVAALLAGDVLATGFYCAELGGASESELVAVIGCGPVGLMAVLAAVELGAGRVLALDSVPERRLRAVELGAETIDPGDAAVEWVREASAGRGVDTVLEAVGTPEATRLAVDLVRPGGTIAAAGFHTESRFAFSPAEAYDKNLTYRAGRCPARHYLGRLLPRLAAAELRPERIVTHRLPLSEGPAAYDLFDRKLDDCVKVVLSPDD